MNSYHPIPELTGASAALVVELDPNALGRDGVPPAPLDRPTAARLAGAVADDLRAILGDIEHLGLVLPGALYDQTELLRPGFPLTKALEDIFKGTLRHGDYTPQLIALGTDTGHFPAAAIDPARAPGSGPLLLLPFTFVGRKSAITTLSSTMENLLLQNGRVSQATAELLQAAFGIQSLNLSYATVADLCALLKVQLDNSGFGPLWELLEHALFRRPGPRQVVLDTGNRFVLEGERVYSPFQTFDDFAQFGPGRELADTALEPAYSAWTQAQRQYTLALAAYGLEPAPVLGGQPHDDPQAALAALREAPRLDGDYLVETAQRDEGEVAEARLEITNQFAPELGTLAYTLLALGEDDSVLRLEHYYPLSPRGLDAIIGHLRRRSEDFAARRQVFHPGRLVWSSRERRLLPAGEQEPSDSQTRH